MAKATTRKVDASGSESESELPKSSKKGVPSKNAKEHDASDEQEENEENGDDEDEEDGEEYEIEAILEARNGSFPEVRTRHTRRLHY